MPGLRFKCDVYLAELHLIVLNQSHRFSIRNTLAINECSVRRTRIGYHETAVFRYAQGSMHLGNTCIIEHQVVTARTADRATSVFRKFQPFLVCSAFDREPSH